MNLESDAYSDAELVEVFERLFPGGFAGADVRRELAPEGWAQSPLAAVFHPTPNQVFEESLSFHNNLLALRRPGDSRPVPPEPTLESVLQEFQERPFEPDKEIRELVGRCLWDVFSDNHEVVDAAGRRLDTGSFRGTGGFLADLLNRQTGGHQYDYMDFYMGTSWIIARADLGPVYRLIFRRLRAAGLEWEYHFPRLFAVDLRPLKEALDQAKHNPEWTNYDPSEALAKEAAEREHNEQLAELREGYREAVDQAIDGPPPATVLAYQAIYRDFPRGWPPAATFLARWSGRINAVGRGSPPGCRWRR